MKFDREETINYINRMFNALIDRVRINQKKNLPFILRYEGKYIKHYIKHGKVKTLYLEYFSMFVYSSTNGSFHPIQKPYLRMMEEMPYTNKRKAKFAIVTVETKFIERIIHELFGVVALGMGSINFKDILDGTAELGINDKRTPLEIIKEKTK